MSSFGQQLGQVSLNFFTLAVRRSDASHSNSSSFVVGNGRSLALSRPRFISFGGDCLVASDGQCCGRFSFRPHLVKHRDGNAPVAAPLLNCERPACGTDCGSANAPSPPAYPRINRLHLYLHTNEFVSGDADMPVKYEITWSKWSLTKKTKMTTHLVGRRPCARRYVERCRSRYRSPSRVSSSSPRIFWT